MPKGANWKKLEERMAELLIEDKARTTPGSGNSKKEEDVVGLSIICQCKDSDKKNISILNKDINRLIESAKLLGKAPLFTSRAESNTLISIPVTDDNITNIRSIINHLILLARLDNLEREVNFIDKNELNLCKKAEKEMRAIKKLRYNINKLINDRIDIIDNRIDVKIMDASTYNLFGD